MSPISDLVGGAGDKNVEYQELKDPGGYLQGEYLSPHFPFGDTLITLMLLTYRKFELGSVEVASMFATDTIISLQFRPCGLGIISCTERSS